MPVREPLEIEDSLQQIPEACSAEMVAESHRAVGSRISAYEGSALVFNVFLHGSPIIGVSKGFERLTQRSCSELLGRSWRIQLTGLADSLIANSFCQDIDSFLRMARLQHIDAMADVSTIMVNSRADGSRYTCHSTLRMVKVPWPGDVRPLPLVVAVQSELGAGEEGADGARHRAREDLERLERLSKLLGVEATHRPFPSAGFFPSPLSFKCILLRNDSTGMRREPHQVPRGCVLMSASSIALCRGKASFEVKVDRTVASWTSRLPLLGFTCTTSENVQCDRCFFGPSPHAFCLGESATLGGTGEAWLRPGAGPLELSVGRRVEDSALYQHLTPDLPEHRRRAPVKLQVGDVLGCCYEELGPDAGGGRAGDAEPLRSRISMHINGDRVLQFEFDAQLPQKPLYGVVDVCYSVYQVSMTDSAAAGG